MSPRLPVFHAFGQDVALETGGDPVLEADSRWRLEQVYGPALGLWHLPLEGHAVDIGAGFGAFALPFALAHPGWRVTCFEPDVTACAALRANMARLGLEGRVTLRQEAIGHTDGRTTRLRRNRRRPSFLSADLPLWETGTRVETFAALPAAYLPRLQPDLLKITAPGQARAVLSAFGDNLPDHVLGEVWTDPPPTQQVAHGKSQVYLPYAGSNWRLQGTGEDTYPPGLDVVVAMYNSADTIEECVDSLLQDAPPDQRIWVVDDGSTDDSVARLQARHGNRPEVSVLSKPNGGCASARNWGRMHSTAAHLAFVDADDLVDPGFFAGLLEMARYSGQGVVQGSFRAFRDSDRGRLWLPPAEGETRAHVPRRSFGEVRVFDLPWPEVVIGQPTIWRRLYRRDFLDGRDIWFPEHIRAFDDQLFQMVSGYHAGHIPTRDDLRYLYRQHPGQDIAQGDERATYSLEMYRMVLRRAVAEGWSDFRPFAVSYFHTLEWSLAGLRTDLHPTFLRGAGELWAYMLKVWGPDLEPLALNRALPEAFEREVRRVLHRLEGFGDSYVFAYLDAPEMHVDMLRSGLPA